MTIVIIGAALAGSTAAVQLREQGYDGSIVLLGEEGHLPYERPPLSKGMLLGSSSFDDAVVKEESWYESNNVDLRLATRVTGIDTRTKTVTTEAATGSADSISYDTVILATGSAPIKLSALDEGKTPTYYLRTKEDSEALQEVLTEGARIAIVGGGWIGLEVAAAARDKGAHVTIFERGPLPLQSIMGPEVAQVFADLHREHGVELRTNSEASAADLEDFDAAVVGVGAAPNTALAEAAGLKVDGGVLVDAQLKSSDEDIYAIGDLASIYRQDSGRHMRLGHWDNAIQTAKHVARVLTGNAEPYNSLPYFFSDQYDLGMEYWGGISDGFDRVEINGEPNATTGGKFQAYYYKGDTVVAAMHVNDWDASDAVKAAVGTQR